MYYALSIGNSDNKLPQELWNKYVEEMGGVVQKYSLKTHFFGGASTWMPWQNVCWIFEMNVTRSYQMEADIKKCRESYNQDSAFLMPGIAQFI